MKNEDRKRIELWMKLRDALIEMGEILDRWEISLQQMKEKRDGK